MVRRQHHVRQPDELLRDTTTPLQDSDSLNMNPCSNAKKPMADTQLEDLYLARQHLLLVQHGVFAATRTR